MKVRPLRSSLKPMCEFIKKFKKCIQADFLEAIKNTPFGSIFMAFYNEEFGGEKGLKYNSCAFISYKKQLDELHEYKYFLDITRLKYNLYNCDQGRIGNEIYITSC